MNKINIKIDENISNYIEKIFFEYNAIKNILNYLLSQNPISQNYLEKYFEQAKQKNIELELIKKNISNKYKPKEINNYNYYFNFDNNEIIYEFQENNNETK